MTKEQAKKILWNRCQHTPETEAAIRVLSEENPQGEWVMDSDNIPVCKICGEVALQRIYVRTPQLLEEVRMVKSNFCPNCGAQMKGGAE